MPGYVERVKKGYLHTFVAFKNTRDLVQTILGALTNLHFLLSARKLCIPHYNSKLQSATQFQNQGRDFDPFTNNEVLHWVCLELVSTYHGVGFYL